MGADLIAFTLVGPPKLKPSKALRKKVLTYAINVIGAATQALKDPDFDWAEDKFIGKLVQETEDLGDLSRMDAETTLDAFLDLWEHGTRDATQRTVVLKGTKYQILTAGEMSWGDEPEGDGYLTIRNADRLGMIDALGIK